MQMCKETKRTLPRNATGAKRQARSRMIPGHLQTLFWDTNLGTFNPEEYPDCGIFRVLE